MMTGWEETQRDVSVKILNVIIEFAREAHQSMQNHTKTAKSKLMKRRTDNEPLINDARA